MNQFKYKNKQRVRRSQKTRARIKKSGRLRLSVFRSSKNIYVQLIDDVSGLTLAAASSAEIKSSDSKTARAVAVGKLIAEKAKVKNITSVTFDRGRYKFHGRIKALADGARAAGLLF